MFGFVALGEEIKLEMGLNFARLPAANPVWGVAGRGRGWRSVETLSASRSPIEAFPARARFVLLSDPKVAEYCTFLVRP